MNNKTEIKSKEWILKQVQYDTTLDTRHAELVCSALPHPSLRSGLSQRDIVHGPASATSRGRSMIEMLGVLAVIGVLSLGSLAGYTMAMNYHRANETIHDVMLRATNVPMKWENYMEEVDPYEFKFPDLGSYATNNAVGYTVKTYAEPVDSAYLYRVVVSDVPSEVCKRIINMNPTDVDLIKVGNGGYIAKRPNDACVRLGSWGLRSNLRRCGQYTLSKVELRCSPFDGWPRRLVHEA